MGIKRTLSYGLLSVFATATVPAQATCCCPRTICYIQVSNLRGYVDLGYERALSADLPSSSYGYEGEKTAVNFSLSPQGKFTKNNLFVETGLLWTQPFAHSSPYFPYANLGLRYQINNLNGDTTAMNLSFEPPDKSLTFVATAPYEFTQKSLWTTAKIDVYRWGRLMPYVSGAIGTTWHQVKPKNNFDLQFNNTPFFAYSTEGENNRDFSYNLGAGLDFMVTHNLWLSLGYQYSYYGDTSVKSNFIGLNDDGKELIIDLKSSLLNNDPNLNTFFKPFHFNHLNTHSIQLTGRYLFG